MRVCVCVRCIPEVEPGPLCLAELSSRLPFSTTLTLSRERRVRQCWHPNAHTVNVHMHLGLCAAFDRCDKQQPISESERK